MFLKANICYKQILTLNLESSWKVYRFVVLFDLKSKYILNRWFVFFFWLIFCLFVRTFSYCMFYSNIAFCHC